MYHHDNILKNKKMILKGIGDNIASSIWKQLHKFGSDVKKFFEDQF